MNQHLATALKLYESRNINLQDLIGWHLCHGIVICNPDVFALCFHCTSYDLEKAVEFKDSDTIYVTMCCGNMASGLESLKDKYKYIAFRRDFKGSNYNRLLNIKNFYLKLQ
jgi:hypothetical protein